MVSLSYTDKERSNLVSKTYCTSDESDGYVYCASDDILLISYSVDYFNCNYYLERIFESTPGFSPLKWNLLRSFMQMENYDNNDRYKRGQIFLKLIRDLKDDVKNHNLLFSYMYDAISKFCLWLTTSYSLTPTVLKRFSLEDRDNSVIATKEIIEQWCSNISSRQDEFIAQYDAIMSKLFSTINLAIHDRLYIFQVEEMLRFLHPVQNSSMAGVLQESINRFIHDKGMRTEYLNLFRDLKLKNIEPYTSFKNMINTTTVYFHLNRFFNGECKDTAKWEKFKKICPSAILPVENPKWYNPVNERKRRRSSDDDDSSHSKQPKSNEVPVPSPRKIATVRKS